MHLANIHDFTIARQFRRVNSPPPPPRPPTGVDGIQDSVPLCLACHQYHNPGTCPLRHAGVEFCGLCGLAHLGARRVCPHLQSIVQVNRMIEALDQSTEDPKLISVAKRYLRGIIASTAQMERNKISKAAQPAPHLPLTSPSVGGGQGTQVVDLTEQDGP